EIGGETMIGTGRGTLRRAFGLRIPQDPPERTDIPRRQFGPAAASQAAGHADRPETHTDQTTHRQADRLEQATDLAIAPLGYDHPIPRIGPFAAEIIDTRERRLAVI